MSFVVLMAVDIVDHPALVFPDLETALRESEKILGPSNDKRGNMPAWDDDNGGKASYKWEPVMEQLFYETDVRGDYPSQFYLKEVEYGQPFGSYAN